MARRDRDHRKAPTRNGIRANAHVLARYAALCQEAGIVPVVEPEVLADGEPGDHSIERCEEVTGEVLETVFTELRLAGVDLSGMLLKPNMVLAGIRSRQRPTVEEVAERTVACLKAHVPAAVPGIAFLSGGQSDEEATAHLSAMNKLGALPWRLTFSYGRALQTAALLAWNGKDENVAAAQKAFAHRARMNSLASLRRVESRARSGGVAASPPALTARTLSRSTAIRRLGLAAVHICRHTPRPWPIFSSLRRPTPTPPPFAAALPGVLDRHPREGAAPTARPAWRGRVQGAGEGHARRAEPRRRGAHRGRSWRRQNARG